MRKRMVVWFYVGVLLAFYGLLLGAAGVYQWSHPPATVLANLHATFWAGIVLLLVGGVYIAAYRPRRGSATRVDRRDV